MVNVQEGFEIMKKKFKPEVAKGFKKKVVVQYNIEGTDGGTWQVIFDNGTMEIVEGEKEKAVLNFTYDAVESFMGIQNGEIDGIQGYTTGKLRIGGPIALAQKIGEIFGAV
ncbi:MAG: SCP2 sterol-binding domain-containing protein [Candidatus Lokiarchaeota archaeon]|nr:SCP2 sterol-binding domain-containing protein [Candidatus Lokiarchaeota archaeon]